MKSDKLDRDKWMKLIKSGIGLTVECGVRPKEELLIELPKTENNCKLPEIKEPTRVK